MLGYALPQITIINSNGQEAPYTIDLATFFEMKNKDQKVRQFDYFIGDGCVQKNNIVFIPTCVPGMILRFDCMDNSISAIHINNIETTILSISGRNNEIWITENSDSSKIYKWDSSLGELKTIALPQSGRWFAPVFFDDYAYLFSPDLNMGVLRICIQNYQVDIPEKLNKSLLVDKIETSGVTMITANDVGLIYIRALDAAWLEYNIANESILEEKYVIDDPVYLEELEKACMDRLYKDSKNGIVINEVDMPLVEFVQMLKKE